MLRNMLQEQMQICKKKPQVTSMQREQMQVLAGARTMRECSAKYFYGKIIPSPKFTKAEHTVIILSQLANVEPRLSSLRLLTH